MCQVWLKCSSGKHTANKILPKKCNLYSKKMGESSICPIYEKSEEFVIILYEAIHQLVIDVWAETPSPVQKWVTTEVDFLELWGKLMSRFNREEIEWIATTMRKIRLRRNKLVF